MNSPGWAILITRPNGKQEFLTVGLTITVATTRKNAAFITREWKKIAVVGGSKKPDAKIVRVVIEQ